MRTLLCTGLLCAGLTLAPCALATKPDLPVGTDHPLVPFGGVPSDLTLDPGFTGDGSQVVDFNDAFSNTDTPDRVFKASDGGYWLAGIHGTGINEPPRVAIAKLRADGTLDTSYRGTGKHTAPSGMDMVYDVAKGIGDTLYFAGSYTHPVAGDIDFGILCLDADGDRCEGFGANGFQSVPFDLGTGTEHVNDVPARIISAYSALYVAGSCGSGSGSNYNDAICITKLSATSGTIDSGFATNGRYHRNFDMGGNLRDTITDIVAYSPSPGAVRLAITGDVKRGGPTDIDGFVATVDGISGQAVPFGPGHVFISVDLGTSKEDHMTRLLRRANGGFVVAGYAIDDTQTPVQAQMVLVAYRADGSPDTGFGPGGMVHRLVMSGTNKPFGLVERPGNRDLVVGLNMRADLFGDSHPIVGLLQVGANGGPQHAAAVLDFPGSSAPVESIGNDLIHTDGAIVSAGSRKWSGLDLDMTISRHIATDSLFADRFGGPAGD
ncbi:hypothetical protein [Dokdonella koreensis]|uniref:Uncharacterized protein n=1 Tax=Dokdonella koreensis DS-123 TaxID=1300342 RepID=A0A167G998_9GAMM|nr:hypothetical protein [Dokdonella koreensis]ANB16292.1 Hypothetical protein I596_253 [Dokdonella koreensis DS-123]